jgi:hypothetical protein
MKFKELHSQARLIDHAIDAYCVSRNVVFPPLSEISEIVAQIFPGLPPASLGWHKAVFRLRHGHHDLVLKVGPKKMIEGDHDVYRRLPHSIRHRLYARIFWHTRYCLLQEFGVKVPVPVSELKRLREIGYIFGVVDVKEANIRCIRGNFRIIDANMVSQRFSLLWRMIELIKFKFHRILRTKPIGFFYRKFHDFIHKYNI